MRTKLANILVFGGLLQDFHIRPNIWPNPGKTLYPEIARSHGGKALNIAIAAARLGVDSSVVGSIGLDDFGNGLIQYLEENKVDTSLVARNKEDGTGLVLIISVLGEEPCFLSCPGASLLLTADMVANAIEKINEDTVVIVNYEISQTLADLALRLAKRKGSRTILIPSPIKSVPAGTDYWQYVDFLIPNLEEAQELLGGLISDPKDLGASLLKSGLPANCITLGANGCLFTDKTHQLLSPSPRIEAIDPIGASDAFCAAFAVGLFEKMRIEEVVRFANFAGAAACMKHGSAESMPFRLDVNQLLATLS